MTELQFLDRFQRQPNGAWACTKPIKVNGPSGPVMILPRSPFHGPRSREGTRSDGCKASLVCLIDWVRRRALTPSRVTALRRKAKQARWINPSAGTPQPATRRQGSELTEVLWGTFSDGGIMPSAQQTSFHSFHRLILPPITVSRCIANTTAGMVD